MEGSARRSELIAIAARSFRTKGFDATTTRDIASASGMQSGSPFYHFKSKMDLLFAVIDEGMRTALQGQKESLAKLPDQANACERLHALVLHHLHVLLSPGNDFIPVMLYEQRALPPALRKEINHAKDRYEQAWRQALQELEADGRLQTNASLARLMLFGAMHGTLIWHNRKQPLSLDALAKQYIAVFVTPPERAAKAIT